MADISGQDQVPVFRRVSGHRVVNTAQRIIRLFERAERVKGTRFEEGVKRFAECVNSTPQAEAIRSASPA